MPVTNFYTVNGTIIGEKLAGGTRVDYLTDQLGSVTATVNQSAQVLNTYRYKPYGDTLAKTGNNPDPTFGWIGTHGYKPTQKKFCDFYVRARHDDSYTGRWTTVDPIGILAGPANYYEYVGNRQTVEMDPSGLIVVPRPPYSPPPPRAYSFNCGTDELGIGKVLTQLCRCVNTMNARQWNNVNKCIKRLAKSGTCADIGPVRQQPIQNWCGCGAARCINENQCAKAPGGGYYWCTDCDDCYGDKNNPVCAGSYSDFETPCREIHVCVSHFLEGPDTCTCLVFQPGRPPIPVPRIWCTLGHELGHIGGTIDPRGNNYCNDVIGACLWSECTGGRLFFQ